MSEPANESSAHSYRPLDGVRVLDVAHLLPGALATRRLADLGADVVKVELIPGAEYLRQLPPGFGDGSITHIVHDHGKRSIALRRDDPESPSRIVELARAADVVVEGSRPGGIARLGLDLAELRRERPGLVVCSITGFGQTGPHASAPAHGLNVDALAGILGTERVEGRPRLRSRPNIGFGVEFGALQAALSVTAAVLCARTTGQGAWLDVSCWDAAVEANRVEMAELAATGTTSLMFAEMGPLYDVYETADGRLMMFCAIEWSFWAKFCGLVERPDLVERWSGGGEVDFGTDTDLAGELTAIIGSTDADTWNRRFLDAELPICEVLTSAQVATHPHQIARGLVTDDHGIPRVRNAVRVVDGPGPGKRLGDHLSAAAPAVGEHTTEILADWLGAAAVPTTEGRSA